MTQLNSESAASAEFQAKWKSSTAFHEENFYVDRVHFWRDLIPEELKKELLINPVGTWSSVRLKPGRDIPAQDPRQVHVVGASQVDAKTLESPLAAGRFYPRGILRDVGGIFPQNIAPFRCLEIDGGRVKADLNHPLAARSLDLSARVLEVSRTKPKRGGSCQAVEDILGVGPGMQARHGETPTDFFRPGAFDREDETPDNLFYQAPRMVNHLDGQALEVVRGVYSRVLQPGTDVLDLMASWNSHVPENLSLKSLHGLGMNREELERNPRLTGFSVADLNAHSRLSFPDQSFDAAICTVSVEYLVRPLEVFTEVHRVLRPGGVFALTFSNRWFPPKAVKVWKTAHEFERMGLVLEYFLRAGGFNRLQTYSMQGLPRPESDKYADTLHCSDPVFAVWGQKA